MRLSCRRGYLFVAVDPDDTMSKGGIWYPKGGSRKAHTGLCLLHHQTANFDENLNGERIVFDRWAARPFKLQWTDGKIYTFLCISQWAVLAVFDTLQPVPQVEDTGNRGKREWTNDPRRT